MKVKSRIELLLHPLSVNRNNSTITINKDTLKANSMVPEEWLFGNRKKGAQNERSNSGLRDCEMRPLMTLVNPLLFLGLWYCVAPAARSGWVWLLCSSYTSLPTGSDLRVKNRGTGALFHRVVSFLICNNNSSILTVLTPQPIRTEGCMSWFSLYIWLWMWR